MVEIECESVPVEAPDMEVIENQPSLDDSSKENGENEELNTSKENDINLKEDVPKRPSIGLKTLSEMNGKDNFIIDLDSGVIKPKKLTGPELLFQKYLKTQGKPGKHHKDTVCMNILSVDNGKLENQKIEVRLDKEVELDHSRPGFSHEKLKEDLKNQILKQRLEKLKQRFIKSETAELEPEDKDHFPNSKDETDKSENSKKSANNEEPDTSDEEWTGENEENSENDSEAEDEESDEESLQKKKKKSKASKFLDEEAVDEDNEGDEESSESESSDEESEEDDLNQTVQKKGRILKAFVDSDDESSQQQPHDIESEKAEEPKLTENTPTSNANEMKYSEDLFNSQATDFTFDEPSISEEINELDALFDKPTQSNNIEDDLMDLCSGQFSAAIESQIVLTNNDFITQNNQDSEDGFITQVPDMSENKTAEDSFVMDVPETSELEEVKTLVQDTQAPSENEPESIADNVSTEIESQPIKKNINKLLESTDDEVEATDNQNEKKKIKRKKKKKDKMKKLGFSDDESDEEQNVINTTLIEESMELEEVEEEEEEEIDQPEVFVDYDSEENEVEVKLTRKEREKKAKAYLENEAELSESDWNSADEDEKGLDKYDSDLADEDEFDQQKLREEVGRIHARKLMDQDIKDVKKIQELLFEDEENDGVGRERKFKWKNQSEGFTLVDENARDVEDMDNGEQEEENEIMWRRMRHERETLINEQSQKGTMDENSILLLDQTSQTVTTANTSSLVKRKFQIIKTNSMPVGLLNSSTESNKPDSPFLIKSTATKKFTHSSFLSRDEKTLTKIASFISTKTDDEVTNLSSHGGNSMSFAPIEKKVDSMKRKSEGQETNGSNGKKRKVENQRFLLDALK